MNIEIVSEWREGQLSEEKRLRLEDVQLTPASINALIDRVLGPEEKASDSVADALLSMQAK